MIGGWILTDGELEARDRAEADAKRRAWAAGLLVNPSADELRRTLATSLGGLRGIAHGGDLHWWDARIATHADGHRMLGLFARTGATEMEAHEHEGQAWVVGRDRDAFERVTAHPSLRGRVDPDGRLR